MGILLFHKKKIQLFYSFIEITRYVRVSRKHFVILNGFYTKRQLSNLNRKTDNMAPIIVLIIFSRNYSSTTEFLNFKSTSGSYFGLQSFEGNLINVEEMKGNFASVQQ